MLGIVVKEERPDLEEAKNQLITQNAQMKAELAAIESQILKMLSESKGSPVDDVDLINALDLSKTKSTEINAKVAAAEETEKDIDEIRMKYVPVAVRSQILFFCVNDLSNVDPMYQYSLDWYRGLFLAGIAKSEKSEDVEQRLENINDYFTFLLYCNVCRSLFEKDKLLFSFLLCARILMNKDAIDMDEWRYLISGSSLVPPDKPNPQPDWLNDRAWTEIRLVSLLPAFKGFDEEFVEHAAGFKRIFDSAEPHRETYPGRWQEGLNSFQKLLVQR
eukprot:UC1_evm1s700